jgi:hypothetical protein
MDGVEQQFQWAVQALAQPADVQLTLFPSFVVVPDELALDFDNWWRASDAKLGKQWSTNQRMALVALDKLLAAMSGKPELWTDLSLQRWSEVRQLAKNALSAFGWPEAVPPMERSIYVRSQDATRRHRPPNIN